MAFDQKGLNDYIDVAARIAEFRTKFPEGSLQPANLAEPFKAMEIGGQMFIVYTAAAYRTPDDPRPGIGCAYELFPGRTPYTKGSELQNAETSAWGRAIVAALAADTKKGIASMEEVRNRQAERDLPADDPFAQQQPQRQPSNGRPANRPTPQRQHGQQDEDVNWSWLGQFEERVKGETNPEVLQGMKRELIEKLKAREIQTQHSAEMTKLVHARISELEKTAA